VAYDVAEIEPIPSHGAFELREHFYCNKTLHIDAMISVPDEILTKILSCLAPASPPTIFEADELFGYNREPSEHDKDSLENYRKPFFTNPYRDLLPPSHVSRQWSRCAWDIIWATPNFGNSTHSFRAFIRALRSDPVLGKKVHRLFLPNLHIHDCGVYRGRVKKTHFDLVFDLVPYFYIAQGTQAAYDEGGSLRFLLAQCPNLLEVVSAVDKGDDAAFHEDHLPFVALDRLRTLVLSGSGNFSPQTMKIIAKGCTSLRKLSLLDILPMWGVKPPGTTVFDMEEVILAQAKSPEEFASMNAVRKEVPPALAELQAAAAQPTENAEEDKAEYEDVVLDLARLLQTNSATLTHLSLNCSRPLASGEDWGHLVRGICSLQNLLHLSFTSFRGLPVSFFSDIAQICRNLRVLDLDGTCPRQESASSNLADTLRYCTRLKYLSLRWTLLATRSVIQSAAVSCPDIRYLAVCCNERKDILSSPKTALHGKFVVRCFAGRKSKLERLWLWDETVGLGTLWRLSRVDKFPCLRGLNITVKWVTQERFREKWKRRVGGRKAWFSYMPL
jgi:hypothetical protein